jgi:hypothetical protein
LHLPLIFGYHFSLKLVWVCAVGSSVNFVTQLIFPFKWLLKFNISFTIGLKIYEIISKKSLSHEGGFQMVPRPHLNFSFHLVLILLNSLQQNYSIFNIIEYPLTVSLNNTQPPWWIPTHWGISSNAKCMTWALEVGKSLN